MSRSTHSRLFLRLRRSTRLLAFVLLVFLARIGMVAACESHDLAELGLSTSSIALVVVDIPVQDDGDRDSTHLTSDCLHCGCHFPVTTPVETGVSLVLGSRRLDIARAVSVLVTATHPDLRPPIA